MRKLKGGDDELVGPGDAVFVINDRHGPTLQHTNNKVYKRLDDAIAVAKADASKTRLPIDEERIKNDAAEVAAGTEDVLVIVEGDIPSSTGRPTFRSLTIHRLTLA